MYIYFDLDSTLSSIEGFDHLAEKKGYLKEFAHITEQSMNGEIDFHDSFIYRLLLLQASKEEQQELATFYLTTIGQDTRNCIQQLQTMGYQIGIISYNFLEVCQIVANNLGILQKHVYANAIFAPYSKEDLLSRSTELLLETNSKATILHDIKQKYPDEHIVFIGDGYQDAVSGNSAADDFIACARHVARAKTLAISKKVSYHPSDLLEQMK